MPKLFDVPTGTRVRITAKLLRWIEGSAVEIVGRDVTFEGTTTNKFYNAHGGRRRLLVKHNIKGWKHTGVWQLNVPVEVINEGARVNGRQRKGK